MRHHRSAPRYGILVCRTREFGRVMRLRWPAIRRLVMRAVPIAVMASILALAVPASAHVDVDSDHPYAGAQNVTLTFGIPNELAPAATVGIRILMPTDHPLIGVTTTAQHGFRSAMRTAHLARAVSGPDGPVSDVVSEVDFSAGRITGTRQFAFTIFVRQLPTDAAVLTFNTLQKYDSGQTVAWIETAVDGAPEPEHPAPVLKLMAARSGGPSGSGTSDSGGGGTAADRQGVTAATASGSLSHRPPILLLSGIALVGVAAIGVGGWGQRGGRSRRGPSTGTP